MNNIEKVIERLKKNQTVFEYYADYHRKKGTKQGVIKAEANETYAQAQENALRTLIEYQNDMEYRLSVATTERASYRLQLLDRYEKLPFWKRIFTKPSGCKCLTPYHNSCNNKRKN